MLLTVQIVVILNSHRDVLLEFLEFFKTGSVLLYLSLYRIKSVREVIRQSIDLHLHEHGRRGASVDTELFGELVSLLVLLEHVQEGREQVSLGGAANRGSWFHAI